MKILFLRNIAIKVAASLLLLLCINALGLVSHAGAQTITGKVVGVADGDTITVLEGTTQHKIRFYGADCPESGQDFGRKAKQFVSGMIFGKQVQVVPMDMTVLTHEYL